MSGDHMTAREFVANEIRSAREAKLPKMSRARLASELYISESLVAKWEKGALVPVPEHLHKLIEILDIPDMIVRVVNKLVSNEVSAEWFGRWPEIEQRARSLWSFEPSLVPGLLQTADYARPILQMAGIVAEVEGVVHQRMERQKILTKDDPPMFVVVMSESVLRHRVGGIEVMCDQLTQLADLAERDNVIVHVVPNDSTVCAAFLSGFVIAGFDGQEVAYVDNQLAGDVIESHESVIRLRRFFDLLRGDALNRNESIDLIRKAAKQWVI